MSVEVSPEQVAEPPADPRPSPFALLFAPDRGMLAQARCGRVRGYLLFAWLCAALLAAALALRVDARASTLAKLEAGGQLDTMSERQILEETQRSERVAQVIGAASALVTAPLTLGLYCVSIVGLSWFLRGRLQGREVAPVAAAALAPGAIADLVDAVWAFQHAAIPPQGVPLSPRSLSALLAMFGRPLHGPWTKLGNALDGFSLWSAILLGFGVAAAARLPRTRAVAATLIGWASFRLLTHVAGGAR